MNEERETFFGLLEDSEIDLCHMQCEHYFNFNEWHVMKFCSSHNELLHQAITHIIVSTKFHACRTS